MTPKQRRNAYVEPSAPEPQKFRAGFGHLLQECQSTGAPRAWIICPQKGTLTGGHIEAALGKDNAKALYAGKEILINGTRIAAYYATKPPNIGDGSPVLAAYLSAKDVNMVDDLYEVPSLVVVPFAVNREQDSDTRAWREKWAAGMVEVKP